MRIEQLSDKLLKGGYRPVQVDIRYFTGYFRTGAVRRPDGSAIEGKNCAYVVLLWDFLNSIPLNPADYQAVIDKIKWNFYNMGFSSVELLNLLCTYEPEKLKSYCLEYDEHWLVCMDTGQTIIFENQGRGFGDIKDILEGAGKPKETMDFPLCTILFIGLNILLFMLVELTGGSVNSDNMLQWGALYWPLVAEQREFFRLFMYMFLHFGLQHLLSNMFVFFFLGRMLESRMKKFFYIILYLGSGLLAGAASMGYNMIRHQEVISAGASGAIFGLTGALAFIIIRHKGKVKELGIGSMILFLILTLYSGFTAQGVDNAAHVGGFAAGFILAAVLYRKPRTEGKGDGICKT